jgi:SOS response regulatory protein OraA/RecX
MASLWIRTYISLGKGEYYISEKLHLKEFPKELIQEVLVRHQEEIRNWDEYASVIEREIESSQKKGKSKYFIRATLQGKYPYFKDEIEELLGKEDDLSGLRNEV